MNKEDILVVIPAGGQGSRLAPLTLETPKPLIRVGTRPLLEHSLLQMKQQGFRRIALLVGYKADAIQDYFGDGSELGLKIAVYREAVSLGTSGCLATLPRDSLDPGLPILVINGDILTSLDLQDFLLHHGRVGAAITIAVRRFWHSLRYGIVERNGKRIRGIREKPKFSYDIVAGIYALDVRTLTEVPRGACQDMPMLINRAVGRGQAVSTFKFEEDWISVDTEHDLVLAEDLVRKWHPEGRRENLET